MMEVAVDTVQANVTGKKDGADNGGGRLAHPGSPRGPPPLTISIKSAMELSGLSRATINRLMWSGKLRSTTVGSRRLINYADFVALLGVAQSEAA
jgi:excisionase family DNA binding protein